MKSKNASRRRPNQELNPRNAPKKQGADGGDRKRKIAIRKKSSKGPGTGKR